jgi:integrase
MTDTDKNMELKKYLDGINDAYTRDAQAMLSQIPSDTHADFFTGIQSYIDTIEAESWSNTLKFRRAKMVGNRFEVIRDSVSRDTDIPAEKKIEITAAVALVFQRLRPILDSLNKKVLSESQESSSRTPEISRKEAIAIMESQVAPITRALGLILLYTGKKVILILSLTWADISFTKDSASIQFDDGSTSSVPRDVFDGLDSEGAEEESKVFEGMSDQSASHRIRRAGMAAGVKLNPTTLRQYCSSKT